MDENSDGTGKPKDQQEEYSADRPQHVALAYVLGAKGPAR
jgi:hypothetical protein